MKLAWPTICWKMAFHSTLSNYGQLLAHLLHPLIPPSSSRSVTMTTYIVGKTTKVFDSNVMSFSRKHMVGQPSWKDITLGIWRWMKSDSHRSFLGLRGGRQIQTRCSWSDHWKLGNFIDDKLADIELSFICGQYAVQTSMYFTFYYRKLLSFLMVSFRYSRSESIHVMVSPSRQIWEIWQEPWEMDADRGGWIFGLTTWQYSSRVPKSCRNEKRATTSSPVEKWFMRVQWYPPGNDTDK